MICNKDRRTLQITARYLADAQALFAVNNSQELSDRIIYLKRIKRGNLKKKLNETH